MGQFPQSMNATAIAAALNRNTTPQGATRVLARLKVRRLPHWAQRNFVLLRVARSSHAHSGGPHKRYRLVNERCGLGGAAMRQIILLLALAMWAIFAAVWFTHWQH